LQGRYFETVLIVRQRGFSGTGKVLFYCDPACSGKTLKTISLALKAVGITEVTTNFKAI
tara:strand:- start:6274 stop:6450 length:177 start_codon:yes stop_codon:yes gene_type:complete